MYRAPAAPSNKFNLGPNPIENGAKRLARLVIIGLVLFFVCFQIGGGAAIIILFGGPIWLILCAISFGAMVGSTSNSKIWKLAKSAIDSGEIKPEWMIRDIHCRSLVLVDESSKKIFINDGTYNFSEVKQFNYRSDGNKCIAECFT